jgi:hypothetical protein
MAFLFIGGFITVQDKLAQSKVHICFQFFVKKLKYIIKYFFVRHCQNLRMFSYMNGF